MNNFKQVSKMLAQRAEEITRHLLPNGKRIGHEWCVGDVSGEKGESLKVCLIGEKAGVWSDFASVNHDHKGDLLDLWALNRKISLMAALKEAQQYLGVGQPKFEVYKPKKIIKPSIKELMPVSSGSPILHYLINERKLSHETIQAFGIGELNREIIFYYFRDGELIFAKYLSLDRVVSEKHPGGKKIMRVEANCEPCLFGWQVLPPNTRMIAITEGELDTMSLFQYGIPSLSVPFGGGTGKKQAWIEYEFDRLSMFDEIFLCLDQDDEGYAALSELVDRLGRHRCRVVSLPLKDANECLQQGIPKQEIQKCFDAARTLDPEELRSASLYVDQVIEEFYPKIGTVLGYNAPWIYAKGKILFRPGELSIWTGFNGHGKSQLLGHVILQAMKEGARVCMASLEIKPKKLLMRLTRQSAALAEPTEEYIRAINSWYGDKLWLFDLVGTAKTERLQDVFLYARQRYGIDVFVIDSFMKLGIDEEDLKCQKAFVEQICDFKNEYNCHVHIVVHPRKSNDETLIPGKLDCKGTGAITDLADNCFTVWRNKAKEEIFQMNLNASVLNQNQQKKLDEPDCIWRCDKQRNGEWEGKIALWFDKGSFQYLGKSTSKTVQFVEFSSANKK